MKRWIIISVVILISIAIVWWFFIKESDIAIRENGLIGQVDRVVNVAEDKSKDENVQKEFTEFGNFWIEIHKEGLDIKAPIVNGVTQDDLTGGVGHHTTTPYPSKEGGNVVLSGHRWLFGSNPAYKTFEHLDKLLIGDNISIFYNGKEYVYEVREKKQVGSKAIELLDQTDDAQITLYTCTPKYTALKRLAYIAKLVDVR